MPSLCSIECARASLRSPGEPSGLQQEFRYQEQRDALRPGRRVRQPRQDEVDDVVGQLMFAVGDEDFLAGDAIAAVGGALGPGAQCADIGAGLRLGQLHRSHPLAGNELRQIVALEFLAAVRGERIDPRHGQHRPETERHRGRIPHFHARGVDSLWQVLPAPLRRGGQAIPAGLRPGAVGVLPARRHDDGASVEARALAIPHGVEGGDHFARETTGLLQNGLDHVVRQVAIEAFAPRRRKASGMIERRLDVGNRSPIGHVALSGHGCGSHPLWLPCAARPQQRDVLTGANLAPVLPGSIGPAGCRSDPPDAAQARALPGPRPAAMVRALRRRANHRRMGRSQVVRQRILIPPFPGSSPGAPASKSLISHDFRSGLETRANTRRLRRVVLSPCRE